MNGRYHAKTVKQKAKRDFEKTWLETARLLDSSGRNVAYGEKPGKRHPVIDLSYRFRDIFLELGFDEYINPSIVEDTEVFRQYGPEAPLILDRVFYLAGLPRQDIGLDDDRKANIREIIPEFDKFDTLADVLREFKKGGIEGDDFIETLSVRLEISESQATLLVKTVFQEFSRLTPQSTNLTLRSHMTANWFEVLSKMQTARMPVMLFSIGSRYRREQRQDEGHLYESTSASIVVMNTNVSLEDGTALAEEIAEKLRLSDFKTKQKVTTSKYYAPGYDWEVYAKHNGKEFEIANLGLYSPVSLANYKIRYPVMNLGFGIERIAMILTDAKDIRKLVYPQYYGEVA